jgi:hypothetical protein
MASKKVNIVDNANEVKITNSNNKIEIVDTNAPSNIEITQPVTSIIQVNAAGPKGDRGVAGPSGSQGPAGAAGADGIFTKLGDSLHFTTSSLQISGSMDILGNLTVNGKSIFIQTSASDSGTAVEVQGRMKIIEKQIGDYIASSSIQIGNVRDTIDCGGFF